MKILSLFDGISCGYLALERAGIPIDKYYASEIDTYAIEIAKANHPDIEEIGDVCNVKGEDYKDIDIIIGGSPCFVKGTKVWTYDGYKDISEVEVGDYVIGLNGEYNQVLKIGGCKKEIWSIKGQGFLETLTTENHPYYVSKCERVGHDNHRELQEPKWVEVKDMQAGDYVGLPIIKNEENTKGITSQEAWLLGRYMADGHTRKDYRKGTTRRYRTVIYSIGDSKLDDFNHITEYHIGKQKHSQSTHRFVINSKRLVELCEDIGCGAINKSMPNWILNLPKDLLIEFFKGYVSGDGYYKGNGVWRCSTISRDMAMSLCLLSAKLFNTGAQIHYSIKPSKHIIQGRTVNQNNSYEITIREYKKPKDYYIVSYDYIWFPIKEIKRLGYDDAVYNLEVANTNSYTANNVIVHNCQNLSGIGNGKGLEGEKSKLFFEFVRLVKEIRPKFFLLENVKMKKEWMERMSEELFGIPAVLINSSLLSAQNRPRLYWVGVRDGDTYKQVEFPMPEDKGITIKDILDKEVDDKYYLSQDQIDRILHWKSYQNPLDKVLTGGSKCPTLTARGAGEWHSGMILLTDEGKEIELPCATQLGNGYGYPNAFGNNKAYCLRAVQPNGVILGDKAIRKLTPTECEKLQTVPLGYTDVNNMKDRQRYKVLGNGWTVDVIAYIFSHLPIDNA